MKKGKQAKSKEFSDLPRLSKDQDRAIRDMMRGILRDPRITSSSPPIPVDIFFLEKDDKMMALFTMGGSPMSQHADMQIIAALDRDTMERIAKEGQDPAWDWMRNIAMHTCVEAVSKGLDLPNALGVQLAQVIRSVNLDNEQEIRDRIYRDAKALAYSRIMTGGVSGSEVSE